MITFMSSFTFRTAETADAERILAFLCEHFVHEEPCIRAMKSNVDEWRPLLKEMVANSLRIPFSTIVTTEEGHVAAVLLNSLWRRDDESTGEDHENGSFPEHIQKFIDVLQKCHGDFWPLAPADVNTVLYREISNVGKPWQRKGIASRMVTEALTKAKIDEYGVGGILSATSSFANQTLLAKQGFQCLKEFPYADIVSCNGEQLVQTDDGSKGMRINFKRIEDFDINA
ncbi:unnamed protein product [Caenorhabditis sp. 36 PRJEB53466]|nr:unnamed protein product [Caenorhabditis sp. 36 PRJEB53466]